MPAGLADMMADPDCGKAKRVMEALLQMGKLDITALRQAYEA